MIQNDYDTLIRTSLLRANQIQYYIPSDKLEDVKYSDEYSNFINDIANSFVPSERSGNVRKPHKHKTLILAASVFIAVAVSISSLLSFSPVARAAALNWLSNITDSIASYMTFGNDISVTTEDQIRAEIIDNINVPDRYSLHDSFSSPDLGYLIYTVADKDRDLTVQYMSMKSHSTVNVASDNMQHSKTTVCGHDADLYISPDGSTGNTLVWSDESAGWIYYIDGYFTGDQLVEIADSICK